KLAQIVRRQQIQIVHAHMARDYPLAAYVARANSNTRLLITRHVLFPLNRLHSVALARVSRVIAVSEPVAHRIREQNLFPAERIVVVPNGIEVERFAAVRSSFNRAEFCRRLGIADHSPLIGSVGELKALKGHEEFLRAAALVVKKYPSAEFLIAGT